jgi:hypothetical protein
MIWGFVIAWLMMAAFGMQAWRRVPGLDDGCRFSKDHDLGLCDCVADDGGLRDAGLAAGPGAG